MKAEVDQQGYYPQILPLAQGLKRGKGIQGKASIAWNVDIDTIQTGSWHMGQRNSPGGITIG